MVDAFVELVYLCSESSSLAVIDMDQFGQVSQMLLHNCIIHHARMLKLILELLLILHTIIALYDNLDNIRVLGLASGHGRAHLLWVVFQLVDGAVFGFC